MLWMRQRMHECRQSHSCARATRVASITRRDICVLWLGMIYQHVSKSYEMRQEQVESKWDETNVPFSLLWSFHLVLSRWSCKCDIIHSYEWYIHFSIPLRKNWCSLLRHQASINCWTLLSNVSNTEINKNCTAPNLGCMGHVLQFWNSGV